MVQELNTNCRERIRNTWFFHLLQTYCHFYCLCAIIKIYRYKKKNWNWQDRLSSLPDSMNIQSTDHYWYQYLLRQSYCSFLYNNRKKLIQRRYMTALQLLRMICISRDHADRSHGTKVSVRPIRSHTRNGFYINF